MDQIHADGTGRTRLVHESIVYSKAVSPDGNWIVVLRLVSPDGQTGGSEAAYPTRGGSPIALCDFCDVGWDPGGKLFYMRFRGNGIAQGGKTFALPLPPGQSFPMLPPSGILAGSDLPLFQRAPTIDRSDITLLAPGPSPSVYAYTRVTTQRNLFRIPLP